MTMEPIFISMPVYNEEEGIGNFIDEIIENFKGYKIHFVVINDCSTDQTETILNSKIENISGMQTLDVLTNQTNIGHGQSTMKGLNYALSNNAITIITLDGDGQFIGRDIRSAFEAFITEDTDVLEGVRLHRTDPWFRKLLTFSIRIYIGLKTHRIPQDGNTPFRIYKNSVATTFLNSINPMSLTPNIEISIIARRKKLSILQFPVQSIPRRGVSSAGTSWQQRFEFLPSRRFITFCKRALIQQIRR